MLSTYRAGNSDRAGYLAGAEAPSTYVDIDVYKRQLIYRGVRVCAGDRVGMQVCYDVHRKQLLLFVVKSISRKVSIQTENRRLTPVLKNVRRAGKS